MMYYGLENEKAIISLDGEPAGLDNNIFQSLADAYNREGLTTELVTTADRVIGIENSIGKEGIDGSFNNGESSTRPVCDEDGGLSALESTVDLQMKLLDLKLGERGLAYANMSNNPLIVPGPEATSRFSLAKPGSYAREVRKWRHEQTIKSQVQNSPSTSVDTEQAPDALNAIIGFGGAIIALYANSPFDEGRITTTDENRLRLWDSYFANSTIASDKDLAKPPMEPFRNIKDYFDWIFGDSSTMFCVYRNIQIGKHAHFASVIPSHFGSIHEYINEGRQEGVSYPSGQTVQLIPTLGDIAASQFMQFAGARLRFEFAEPNRSANEYMEAFNDNSSTFDSFLRRNCVNMYIEGRDAGSNFPDADLAEASSDAAKSMVMSVSALQAGLIRNLAAANQILARYPWRDLMELRSAAIQDGLAASVGSLNARVLSDELIAAAYDGLDPSERFMLDYPTFVLETNQNGATRARKIYEKMKANSGHEKIKKTMQIRRALNPSEL